LDELEPVGWGVLGAAGVARRRFVPALRAARNARLVAVGSRSGERAAELTGLAGAGRPLGSCKLALERLR
jgi:predicted dehydrogenase